MERWEEVAEQKKTKNLNRAEEEREKNLLENEHRKKDVEDRCDALNGEARRREVAIKDEIRTIAEKLLKINEQIQERLQALTEL